jgi:hypothetical protein
MTQVDDTSTIPKLISLFSVGAAVLMILRVRKSIESLVHDAAVAKSI